VPRRAGAEPLQPEPRQPWPRISDAFGVPVTRLVDVPDEPERAHHRPGRVTGVVARAAGAGQARSSRRPIPPWAGRTVAVHPCCPASSFGGDAHAPATPGDGRGVEEGTLTLTVAGIRHQVSARAIAPRFPGGLPATPMPNEGTERILLTMIGRSSPRPPPDSTTALLAGAGTGVSESHRPPRFVRSYTYSSRNSGPEASSVYPQASIAGWIRRLQVHSSTRAPVWQCSRR